MGVIQPSTTENYSKWIWKLWDYQALLETLNDGLMDNRTDDIILKEFLKQIQFEWYL